METHVKILGVLYIVLNGLTLLTIALLALLFFVFGVSALAMEGTEEMAIGLGVTGLVGGLVMAFCVAIALPGFITGFGLLGFKPWARVLAIVLGALGLLQFPFGTALGIYTLVILLKDETGQLFSPDRYYSTY
ncbi:MAG: hypothetical protein GY851_09740 [bacterium]|nr:hypothetical protein [bacterium]